MRIAAKLVVLFLMLFACRPSKQLQKIQTETSRVDTGAARVLVENKQPTAAATPVEDVLKKVVKNRIDYSTFTAKIRVQYEGKEGADEATAFVRLKKDSAMWLSLRGALGIEGARVLVTKDSVKVMNLLKKNIQNRPISYLQEITDLPLDLNLLQDVVVGNPVFLDNNIVSTKIDSNNALVILMSAKSFKNWITVDSADLKLLHLRLEIFGEGGRRTCEMAFGNYEKGGNALFPTIRKISVAGESDIDVHLDFKQYTFDVPITFPFNIPKNYKRL